MKAIKTITTLIFFVLSWITVYPMIILLIEHSSCNKTTCIEKSTLERLLENLKI